MEIERQLWDAEALGQRWGVSKYSVIRLMKSGDLKSVTIGTRRLVARDEMERVERYGAGKPRKSPAPGRTKDGRPEVAQ